MDSLWYPVFILACAAVLSATAIFAAVKTKTSHPLVTRRSQSAAWWFFIATIAYVTACVLLFTTLPLGIPIGCGLLGLIACAAGYIAAGGGGR
ncbi:MAG: hypothetical protein Q4D85_14040 [Corynebacterium sp.]|uniref:hypothetical protein n=1 Tax=Corynebacterium sp. TaxID=1720 RepID=UPI0026DCE794|nr:hypothetical protein [Corynebacterium sp.]MDO5099856.1 hypothetical protein [Corynebacterium sp.]